MNNSYSRILPSIILLLILNFLLSAQESECMEALIKQEAQAGESLASFSATVGTEDYDVNYYRLNLEMTPAVLYIKGVVTTYLTPTAAPIETLIFDLHSAVTVDSVKYDGSNIPFSRSGHTIVIPLLTPITGLDSIKVYYQGAPGNSGFGSMARELNCGDHTMWTLSEPFGAKDWWPCKQSLDDKADSIDIIITVPEPYEAASNGLLVSTNTNSGFATYHWKHRYPITAYLVFFALADYDIYTHTVSNNNGNAPFDVLNYVYKCNSSASSQTPVTVNIMDLFIDLFGPYPFDEEKYGHAQFGWGGGMEHQTMSSMGGFSHLLIAHELAHQWFGDQITCGSWAHIWLNEGFATYLEGMTYEHGLGPNTWQNWKQSKINHVTNQPGGSVFVADSTNVNRIFSSRLSYSKGAMLLHMLRWKLGDDDFFMALNDYLNDPAVSYGYAVTDNLVDHLENVSGQDLTEFMDDWFYGEGYPTFLVEWNQNPNNLMMNIKLSQTPSIGSEFYELPVPIRVFTEGPNDTTFILNHTHNGQTFALEPGFIVTDIIFDPDRWLVAHSSIDILPLELLQFNASLIEGGRSVLLDWQISSAINFSHFEIERSVTGKDFSSIAHIKQNEAEVRVNFEFLDSNFPMNAKDLYYRLKMVDHDQSIDYSQIRTVSYPSKIQSDFEIFPNPTKGNFKLISDFVDREMINISIYTLPGKKVLDLSRRNNLNSNEIALDLDIPAGVYLITLMKDEGYTSDLLIIN